MNGEVLACQTIFTLILFWEWQGGGHWPISNLAESQFEKILAIFAI